MFRPNSQTEEELEAIELDVMIFFSSTIFFYVIKLE